MEIDGEFKSVRPVYNQLVVNLGDTFSRITDFALKATKHRVLDIGIERFSSPFFLEPKHSARIPRNMLAPEEDEPIIFGEWLVEKLQTYVEWQGMNIPPKSKRGDLLSAYPSASNLAPAARERPTGGRKTLALRS